MNMDPAFLAKLKVKRGRSGPLEVPVAAEVPAKVMGSGLGRDNTFKGDYDIQLFDEETVAEFGLDAIRLGDIVAITDADHRFGRTYRTGAVSIGVVVHSECTTAGHGPGVTTIMAAAPGGISFRIDRDANIAKLLGIGRSRRRGRRPKG